MMCHLKSKTEKWFNLQTCFHRIQNSTIKCGCFHHRTMRWLYLFQINFTHLKFPVVSYIIAYQIHMQLMKILQTSCYMVFACSVLKEVECSGGSFFFKWLGSLLILRNITCSEIDWILGSYFSKVLLLFMTQHNRGISYPFLSVLCWIIELEFNKGNSFTTINLLLQFCQSSCTGCFVDFCFNSRH